VLVTDFICPECGKQVIDPLYHNIKGCDHYPADELTEISGKHLSDNVSIEEADRLAFRQMTKQINLDI
jgi:hypothetical protein